MDAIEKHRRNFVARLASENQELYGRTEGRGVLRALELTFEHPWVYIFELIQNALDASAQSIGCNSHTDTDHCQLRIGTTLSRVVTSAL